MDSTIQSLLPVVSTKCFSLAPNERLSVQNFLREVARSSRLAQATSRTQDEEVATSLREPLILPRGSRAIRGTDQLQSLSTNVSKEDGSILLQCLVSKKHKARKQDLLSPHIHPALGSLSQTSPRIIRTYSKKSKTVPLEHPTCEILPPPSHPRAKPIDEQKDANSRTGPRALVKNPVEPGKLDYETTPLSSSRTPQTISLKSVRGKAERAANSEIVNADEQRPTTRKRCCRRAPVEGLVFVHHIPDNGAYPSEIEVSATQRCQFFLVKPNS